jgi:hypothetical protein
MRKLILLLIVLIGAVSAHAQNAGGMVKVDWKEIKALASENPDSISLLVKRMTSLDDIASLTLEEAALAFYGQSVLSDGNEEPLIMQLYLERAKNTPEKVRAIVEEALELNPLNLEANIMKLRMVTTDVNVSGGDKSKERQSLLYNGIVAKMLNVIASTGDGTEQKPFYVTRINDEYMLMEYYLGLDRKKRISQSLEHKGDHSYDCFDLKEKSEKYDRLQIYFEINRALETEKKAFDTK